MIDRLFDILNSRNPRARGYKAPIGNLNWAYKSEFLSKARKYLLDLVMMDGKPLHQSKRLIFKYLLHVVLNGVHDMLLCTEFTMCCFAQSS